MYKCLSIAGFDSSGGAGIQADLKTFSATGTYGMSVLTAIPVQNTCGVRSCYNIEISCIEEQLEAIFDDITPDAIKIGMLFSADIIKLVANFLKQNGQNIPIILDPVMVAKSGDPLLQPNAVKALKTELIPLVDIITPNLPEAQTLAPNIQDKHILAQNILSMGCKAVLLKGGHDDKATSDDLFLTHNEVKLLSASRLASKNTHGTGCTLSAAITSYIAQGANYFEACTKAKKYLYNAILYAQNENIGKGNGPVHHFHHLWKFL